MEVACIPDRHSEAEFFIEISSIFTTREKSPVEEKVIDIVSEQLSVSKDEITRESSFIDDLHADSLDLVELGMKFEEEFGVSIPDEDYEGLRTVGDAIDYIEARGKA